MTPSIFVQNFDTDSIPLREWASSALRVPTLEMLHARSDLSGRSKYEAMRICRKELEDNTPPLKPILDTLFALNVVPLVGCAENAFQMPPTFRVHLHGCGSVSSLHRDRDYGMPATRRTAWIPLTRVWGNNSLWIEGGVTGKLEPIELEYGQFIIFDSANIVHGSVTNDTGSSRVSFDCRFTPGIHA
jgi:hypothetical protein